MLDQVTKTTLTIDGIDVTFNAQYVCEEVMVWTFRDTEEEIRFLDAAMRIAGGSSAWTWDDVAEKWVVVAFFDLVPGIAHFAC